MNYQNYRPLGFGDIPFVTKNLIIVNILVFVFSNFVIKTIDLNSYLNLYPFSSSNFKPHQFITHMFMHADFSHLIFNMFGLYLFGPKLESLWGPKRFINFYLICGLLASFGQIAYSYYSHQGAILLGASGAIAGLLGATGFLFPNSAIGLFMFPPIKFKYFVPIYIAASFYRGFSNSDNVAHFAHLGGLFAGIIIVIIWNKTNRKNLY